VSPAVPQRRRCHLGEHVPYRDLGPDHFDRLAKNHPSLRPSAGATRPPGHDRTRAVEGAAFWDKPGWHVLEERFELVLANAAHIRNVPGRKSDVTDGARIADWIGHDDGPPRASYSPWVARSEPPWADAVTRADWAL